MFKHIEGWFEDLCISLISQFFVKPTIAHYIATIRVLRYIKGASITISGLFLSSSISVHLKVFCHSDWDTCSDLRQTDFSMYFRSKSIIINFKEYIKLKKNI